MGFLFNWFHNNEFSICGLYPKKVMTKQPRIQPNYEIKEWEKQLENEKIGGKIKVIRPI